MAHSAPTPILFTHYGDRWIRGSEQLLLDLLTHLDPARVRPIVWCNQIAMADTARALGFTTYRSDFEIYFDYQSPRFRLGRYRALMREARDLVREHEIRVLHSNSAGPCQWLAPVARGRECRCWRTSTSDICGAADTLSCCTRPRWWSGCRGR